MAGGLEYAIICCSWPMHSAHGFCVPVASCLQYEVYFMPTGVY